LVFRRGPLLVSRDNVAAATNRRQQGHEKPIPDAERAIVSREKLHGYLLNRSHPDGGAKAVWFGNLGYERDEWRTLANDLLAIAKSCEHYDTERSPFGVKYKASGTVCRPGHRPGRVLTVWIVEDDEPPRLVTAHPDDT